MKAEKDIDLMLNLLNEETMAKRPDSKIEKEDIKFITNDDSHFVPIKMTKKEVLQVIYAKDMLTKT